MPAPTSPLARARTIAWYSALRRELQSESVYQTANELNIKIKDADEMISGAQCYKWSKGQRCAAKWIREINTKLGKPAPRETYETGPCEEPLWFAFRLPSTLPDPLLILMPPGEELGIEVEGKGIAASVLSLASPTVVCQKIRDLSVAVARFMFAAEAVALATAQFELESAASVFSSSSGEGMGSEESVLLNQKRIAELQQAHGYLNDCAAAAESELEKVGLSAQDIVQLARSQFLFLSKRHHPKNIDMEYIFDFNHIK